MHDWVSTLRRIENRKNYCVNFYKTAPIMVTPRDAAKIKLAILNDIKCFEIDDSVYMVANVCSIERKKLEVAPCVLELSEGSKEDTQEQIEARKECEKRASMNFYFDRNQKLIK